MSRYLLKHFTRHIFTAFAYNIKQKPLNLRIFMENTVKNIKLGPTSYFAAANSYDGFKSYFDLCFTPLLFDRIYIIKGGPGTGKSSLMRRVLLECEKYSNSTESIFCSSDVNSLDGIILRGKSGSVALVDGTAPHIVEPHLPGVCEVIINLGEYFNLSYLKDNRDRIKSLNDKKNMYYRLAYNELALSSVFGRNIRAEFSKHFDYSKAKALANELVKDMYSEADGKSQTRLISAFGKDGKIRLSTLEQCSARIYSLKGNTLCAEIFLQILASKIKKTSCNFYLFPNCLDTTVLDAIYLPDISSAVIINSQAGESIDCDEFLISDSYPSYNEEFARIEATLLSRSKGFFSLAAENHFLLEKIYSAQQDFIKVNTLASNMISEIKNILL